MPQPVVFVALHGPYGEDGTVQAILETAGLAYTGSGVAASAIGMDKLLFKRIARGAGLPVLDWVEVERAAWDADRAAVLAELDRLAAGAPDGRLIAKPACLGSSVGMGIAHRPGEREAIIDGALVHDARAIVEPCLDHPRELEMGVLGNIATGLALLGPGEVIPGHEFYDYADKYAAGSRARTIAAAAIPEAVAAEVRRIGGAAFTLIGAAGFARVDFLLDRASGRLTLNEINTIPGFTPISLYPKVAEAAGHLLRRAVRPDREPWAPPPGRPDRCDVLPPRISRGERRPPGPRRPRPAAQRPAARLGRVLAAPRPRGPGHAGHGRADLGGGRVSGVRREGGGGRGRGADRGRRDPRRPRPRRRRPPTRSPWPRTSCARACWRCPRSPTRR